MHISPDLSDASPRSLTHGGNVRREFVATGEGPRRNAGFIVMTFATLILTLFVTHFALAEGEASGLPIQIEVASIRLESIQNPEIQSAKELRRYYVVEYVARNTSAESKWLHWTDPLYIGQSQFHHHRCRILPAAFPPDDHAFRTRELEPAEAFRFSTQYPVLAGYERYEAEFAVAGELPDAIAKRLRARGDNDSDRSGSVAEFVRQNFKRLRVNFDLPDSETRPAPLQIERLSCETRGTIKFKEPDGNRYVRPKRVKCTYRFTNRSDEPVFLLIDKDSSEGRIGRPSSLRWSDSIICIRQWPKIHFVEIAAAESTTLTFTWPCMPIIEEIAYAANLSQQDAAILKSYQGKPATGELRKWMIEHTTTVWIDHDADVMPKRVDE